MAISKQEADRTAGGNRASDGTTQNAPKNNNTDDFDFAAEAEAVSRETGVKMLPGDPSEPVGPEDALGEGPKRGDYRDVMRLEAPHEARPLTDITPGEEPNREIVPQKERVEQVGDAKGKKGGVDTTEDDK
jgi:hypothetical protein